MGTVKKIYDTGYNRGDISGKELLKYTNTSTAVEYLSSVIIGFGVAANGTYYNAGDSVTGNGQPRDVTIYYGSSTATVTIKATVGSSTDTNGNKYPKFADCGTYTFEFSSPIEVAPKDSVILKFSAPYNNSTLVFNKRENPTVILSDGQLQDKTSVVIFINNKPHNTIPYIYHNGEWIVATPHIYHDNNWT